MLTGSMHSQTSNWRFLKALFKLYCLPTAASSSFFGEEQKEVVIYHSTQLVTVSVIAVLNSSPQASLSSPNTSPSSWQLSSIKPTFSTEQSSIL